MQTQFNADFKYACLLTLLVALMIYSAVSCSSPPGIVEPPQQATAGTTKPSPATDSSTPVLVSPSSTTTFPTATITSMPLSPSLTPVPDVRNITGTLLIDSAAGRIYAGAEVDGQPGGVALSTTDGSPLAVYPYSGRLALDQNHHRLLVDQGQIGIVVLDSMTGYLLTRIELPVSDMAAANPQVDATRGIAYIFRKNTVYAIDVLAQAITMSKTLSVPFLDCGRAARDARITRSFYDPSSNTLYISFYTYSCFQFYRDTILEYDAANLEKRGSLEVDGIYQTVAFEGSLYGDEQFTGQLPFYVIWAWRENKIWFTDNSGRGVSKPMGIVVDPKRRLLYESLWTGMYSVEGPTKTLRISSTATRELLNTVNLTTSPLKNAQLAGYDPYTDHLFFLEDGKLIVVPTTSILPVSPIKP